MPWLSIHITLPMLLLAAVGLEPAVVTLVNLVKNSLGRSSSPSRIAMPAPLRSALEKLPARVDEIHTPAPTPNVPRLAFCRDSAAVGVIMAVLLLQQCIIYEVSYVHAADGPHEMLVCAKQPPTSIQDGKDRCADATVQRETSAANRLE
jgi:predicted membrane-bound mannosyltransferase